MRRPPPGRERRWAETAEEARSVPRRCRIGKVCAECFPLPQRVRHRGGAPGRLHGSAGNPSTQSNRSPGWGRLPPQQQLQPHSRRGTAVIGRASLRSPGFAAGWNAPGSETAPRGDSSCYVLRPSPNCMTYKFSISCMRYKILGGWSVVRMSAIDIAVTGVGLLRLSARMCLQLGKSCWRGHRVSGTLEGIIWRGVDCPLRLPLRWLWTPPYRLGGSKRSVWTVCSRLPWWPPLRRGRTLVPLKLRVTAWR